MLHTLITYQLIAHLITDFYCQTDSFCEQKEQKLLSVQLLLHTISVFVCSWLCSLSFDFWWSALIITITHTLFDICKILFKHCNSIFFIDQCLHLLVIIGCCYIFCSVANYTPLIAINQKYTYILLGVLFCLKPTNIIIQQILKKYGLNLPKNNQNNQLSNAGKVIRCTGTTTCLNLCPSCPIRSIRFLNPAKTILRFRDTETAKTEYVLIGTLLSFSISIFTGILINKLTT